MAVINDVITVMMLRMPFFSSLLMRYEIKENARINPPTLCVGNRTIQVHPEFFAGLSEAEGVFGFAHEIMHVVWGHLPRLKAYRDAGIGPDGLPYDFPLMNEAMDYVINDALKEDGHALIPGVMWSAKFPYTMTPEEVYCILNKQKQQAQQKPKPGQGQPGQGQPGGPPGDPSDEDGDEPAPGGKGDQDGEPMDSGGFDGHDWEEEGEPVVGPIEVLQAANVCKASRGTLPCGVDRVLGTIKKPAVSPWKILRQAVTSALRGHDQTTWKRLQRRMIVRSIGIPGRVANGAGKIGVVGDVSGSIDQRMLTLFGGHMAAIMDEARPECLMIFWTDAIVHRVDTVRSSTELRSLFSSKFKAPGGGGTDMTKGVDAAVAAGCDCVVVLTDGYTPFGNPSKKKVIWAITSSHVNAPHGKTIHIADQ